ncbi:hypothetical protein F2Q70_00043863 [Brassica cretica]|uniref:Uncharacterized protein n=1 Tax=Brassica cretica TaxID=69181 RepID=A0A8S9KKT4_BRACR|nr:hypothetical protein F2Q70_00043863 [Brassica cretica]KAF3515515.1 hypothetical protein DY000_02061349 [Brassica cretica]
MAAYPVTWDAPPVMAHGGETVASSCSRSPLLGSGMKRQRGRNHGVQQQHFISDRI